MTICTMAGCCGSCVFCSVRNSFIRNLTAAEIVGQVQFLAQAGRPYGRAASPNDSKEFHVLYSRMGEPSLNMSNVLSSAGELSRRYPHVKIGLSTLGWKRGICRLLEHPVLAPRIMLQFSAHGTEESLRTELLGIKSGGGFMTLREMAGFIREFRKLNPRQVSLNFILLKGRRYDFIGLGKLFRREDIYVRLSPLNVTANSERTGLGGLLQEQDVLGKAALSSAELRSVIANLQESGFAYAYAPAIDEEIRSQAACGQALEALKDSGLRTFEKSALDCPSVAAPMATSAGTA